MGCLSRLTYHRADGFSKNAQHPVQLLIADAIGWHENNRVANRACEDAALAHLSANLASHAVGQRIRSDLHRPDEPDLAYVHDMRQFAAAIQAGLELGDLRLQIAQRLL